MERELIQRLLLEELKEAEETRDYLDKKLESGQALGAKKEYLEIVDQKLVLANDYIELIHSSLME